ncbi:MAG: tetratricopeptide repeat protein [Cyclobacteriaceae bacterium]
MKKLTVAFIAASFFALAQEPLVLPADSLEQQLQTAKGTSRVKVLNLLFKAYINQDPVKATGYTKEALTLATEFEDANGMAASYNNLGVAYKNQGALDKALENYLTAESIYRKTGNRDGAAATHNNIGTIYSLKKDFEKSKQFFEESLKAFSELKDSSRLIITLNNLGNVYSDLGKYQEALDFFNQSTEISEALKLEPTDALLNTGNVLIRQNKAKEALEFLAKAAEKSTGENDQLTLMNVKSSTANALLLLGDLKGSERNLLEALNICRTLQAFYFEPQIFKTLAETYARENRMADAYKMMLEYEQAREKVFSEESGRRIAQMEMVIDIQEKEKQIEALKQEELLKTIELQRTQLAVIVAVISILVIALGINAFLHRKNKKVKV